MTILELIEAARRARSGALALYSGFRVGAALLTRSQQVYLGSNIESSSYSLTICAERVALFKALSEGEREFEMIAIIADSKQPCPPCGACRQVLWDFAPNIQVVLADAEDNYQVMPLAELLPHAFEGTLLK